MLDGLRFGPQLCPERAVYRASNTGSRLDQRYPEVIHLRAMVNGSYVLIGQVPTPAGKLGNTRRLSQWFLIPPLLGCCGDSPLGPNAAGRHPFNIPAVLSLAARLCRRAAKIIQGKP
jgi:hypothetical protein